MSCQHDDQLQTGGYQGGDVVARVWVRRIRYVSFSYLRDVSRLRVPDLSASLSASLTPGTYQTPYLPPLELNISVIHYVSHPLIKIMR